MNEKFAAIKKTVAANKTKILVTALAVTTSVALIERAVINQHRDFLREHCLDEEFYAQTED